MNTARLKILTLLPLALLAAACAAVPVAGNHADPVPAPRYPDRALSGGSLYPSRPDAALYSTAGSLRASQPALSAGLMALAKTPSAYWAAGQPGEMRQIRALMAGAARSHAIPVIVAYNIPGRDACGKFSGSRGPSPAGYEAWIGQLAAAIGGGTAVVVVEPDAVPDIVDGCLPPDQAARRYQLLDYAMKTLGALPAAKIYLDAGNPGMYSDPSKVTGPLERAGVRSGRGFSANVSNFQWTNWVNQWSEQLESDLGGGLGAVVDTSRDGNGPYTGPDSPQWCNPPGRAPGPQPRLDPGPAGIDAYLWIKDPGLSDGPCNGGPPAGQYWAEGAERLAQAAQRQGSIP